MAEELKSRSEVDVNLTWDLSLIYKTDDDMWADLETAKQLTEQIISTYKGNLTTPENINNCLELYRKVREYFTLCGEYGYLAVEVDYYNMENQVKSGKIMQTISKASSELSFINSEINEQPDEVLKVALDIATNCKGYIEEVIRNKPHMLSKDAERVLSAIQHTISTPYEVYNVAKLADTKFDNFEVNGKSYPLGYSLFEDDYEYEPDTAVRRAAFAAFSKKIKEYENTTATAYNAYVQHDKIMSGLRNFSSTFEYNLFEQKVTLEMYNRQIDLIMKYLAPHMRKYAKLIQRVHKLDKMTYADLKLPIDDEYAPDLTIEDARKYIADGLSCMGDEYVSMVNEAFSNRWLDLAQNKGKCTGGFCASPYRKPSFILTTWNGKMADVFTLAHELGHAGHFKACNEAQSIFDTDVSSYFVEAPSTINEMLMSHYMLKQSDDPRFKRWVLSNMIGKTYYHNFVTHLLEGAYQREVYKVVEAGESVNAESLSAIFKDILTQFWGDAVELNEGAELTWMRQPHYYMGLYSYCYSASLTIATEMCKRIEEVGQPAIDDWKEVLKAGGTLDPIGLAKLGGIDITTDAALLDTIEIIGGYIDEMIQLTDELEGK